MQLVVNMEEKISAGWHQVVVIVVAVVVEFVIFIVKIRIKDILYIMPLMGLTDGGKVLLNKWVQNMKKLPSPWI